MAYLLSILRNTSVHLMATLDRRTHKTPYLDMKLRDNSAVEVRAARLRDLASRPSLPGKPPGRWPPARAVAERTVTTWPVVQVGVVGMPADTRLCRAPPPHPSEHSPHLCLSLLSHGRDPGQLSWPPTSRDPREDSNPLSTRDRGAVYGQAGPINTRTQQFSA